MVETVAGLVPSGKRTHNWWKDPPFFMGKLSISMAIFNSYVKLPRGYHPVVSIFLWTGWWWLEHDWMIFPIILGIVNHPQLTNSYFSEVYHQPVDCFTVPENIEHTDAPKSQPSTGVFSYGSLTPGHRFQLDFQQGTSWKLRWKS